MHQIHLDTDLGGDMDDLCALAMLLRWSKDIQLTGVTTVAEANGRRAGYARYLLDLEGKNGRDGVIQKSAVVRDDEHRTVETR